MKRNTILLIFAVLPALSAAVSAGDGEKIKVNKIVPFFYCAVEKTGSYDQHEDAFRTLYEQAEMQGLGSDFVAFGVYYDDPNQTPVEDLKWEIGFALEDSAKVKEPLKVKKWDHTLMAELLYEGSFASPDFAAAHAKLFQWIMQNGYTPSGPMMEKYIEMPMQNPQGEWVGKIRIMMPVAKKS